MLLKNYYAGLPDLPTDNIGTFKSEQTLFKFSKYSQQKFQQILRKSCDYLRCVAGTFKAEPTTLGNLMKHKHIFPLTLFSFLILLS